MLCLYLAKLLLTTLKVFTVDTAAAIKHATKLGISEKGISLIKEAFDSEPSRRVKASKKGKNYALRIPSQKLGFTVQAESSTIEFPFFLKEIDKTSTLSILDQPPKLPLSYKTKTGRKHKQRHTLDYLVISKHEITYIECKNKKELLKIARKRPDHISYHKDKNTFSSPALERFLAGTGITYEIVPKEDISTVEAENLELLYDYTHKMDEKQYKKWLKEITKQLSEYDGVTVENLLSINIPPVYIYSSIAKKDVFFPITDLTLLDSNTAFIFLNEESYKAFTSTDAKDVDRIYTFKLNKLNDLVRKASPEKISLASKTISLIHKVLDKEIKVKDAAKELGVNPRTFYRRIESFVKKEEHLGSVIPNHSSQGNREPRQTDRVERIINQNIADLYNSKKAGLGAEVYRRVVIECKNKNEDPPSRQTIYNRINAISPVLTALKRISSKSSYQIDILIDEDNDLDLPFSRPTRFLQYCHIDHTQIDVFTKEEGIEKPRKAWLTAIRCAHTRKWLGAYISYNYPSYVSVMMCLRSMVSQFGVLPEYIFVDGGLDLNCTSLEVFCAAHGIIKVSREGQPRKGGPIERSFETLNTTFFHNLEGNSKAAKNVRQLDKKDHPSYRAKWSIDEIKQLLNTAFRSFNENQPQYGDMTANDLEARSRRIYGVKPKCIQKMDEQFLFETFPLVPKQEVTIRQSKYVRFNKMDYFSNKFHDAPKKPTKYKAKWDPENYRIIYIYFNGEWIEAKTRKRHVYVQTTTTSESVIEERTVNQQEKAKKDYLITDDIEKEKSKLIKNRDKPPARSKQQKVEHSTKSINQKDTTIDDPWLSPIPNSRNR